MIRIGFGVGFLDSRCGHPIYPYRRVVEKTMLCNECAANLRDGSWEVLMSSFVLGRIQDCDDLRRMVRVP